jgi:hypothetical protein
LEIERTGKKTLALKVSLKIATRVGEITDAQTNDDIDRRRRHRKHTRCRPRTAFGERRSGQRRRARCFLAKAKTRGRENGAPFAASPARKARTGKARWNWTPTRDLARLGLFRF